MAASSIILYIMYCYKIRIRLAELDPEQKQQPPRLTPTLTLLLLLLLLLNLHSYLCIKQRNTLAMNKQARSETERQKFRCHRQ